MIFKKGMKEYQGNGIYLINDELWLTVWAYKGKFKGNHDTPANNTKDSNMLAERGCMSILTIPDKGNYPNVKAFRESDIRAIMG
ncbi:TPA: hypothetical protein RQN07_002734 [Aeromonas dhakensis]|uniref:hypothetical protein n=1 Tax=Aeromonas dhakensis TaxID=196024 RepID=UPI00288EBBE9|nr:hypothetical protein [Aeromonas dhakensis]HDX8469002.1 hypothetical protein [Aeromonas dhakensis]HDZ8869517.1 hypothetical protein [Aeromonas dhakensis]HDZ8931137.1 hypothetical protein [Aeromonas dhakensis]HEA3208343.1 hypothetical protein [Aeromonas dhakensis]